MWLLIIERQFNKVSCVLTHRLTCLSAFVKSFHKILHSDRSSNVRMLSESTIWKAINLSMNACLSLLSHGVLSMEKLSRIKVSHIFPSTAHIPTPGVRQLSWPVSGEPKKLPKLLSFVLNPLDVSCLGFCPEHTLSPPTRTMSLTAYLLCLINHLALITAHRFTCAVVLYDSAISRPFRWLNANRFA